MTAKNLEQLLLKRGEIVANPLGGDVLSRPEPDNHFADARFDFRPKQSGAPS